MIPAVDPHIMKACLDKMEEMSWRCSDFAELIAQCALWATGGDNVTALSICRRVQALILTLEANPSFLTDYGPQPKDRIPTELRRAAGATPLSCAASGFDAAALQKAALLVATPRGSA